MEEKKTSENQQRNYCNEEDIDFRGIIISIVKLIKKMSITILTIILLKTIWIIWMCWGNTSFESEKTDILKRRRYLINQTMAPPRHLINKMPSGIGEQFQGEWAIYTCSMLSAALTNIAYLFPETKEESIQVVDSLINKVMSPEIRKYDADRWGEDSLESLDGNNSHISYISHLAWMISHYKFLGGDKYDYLFQTLCATMNRRMFQHESYCLQTYPGERIYMPDMLVAIAALSNYAKLYGGKYSKTVAVWMQKAKADYIDSETGLLSSFLTTDGKMIEDCPSVRGSYSALNCYYLTFIDKAFAKEQFEKFKKRFLQSFPITGFREYQSGIQLLKFDIDAGPVVFNLSPTGTAFALGCTTYYKDFKLRKKLLYTAELAGSSIVFRNEKHYLLANVALVGEAIVLAMKTALEWED